MVEGVEDMLSRSRRGDSRSTLRYCTWIPSSYFSKALGAMISTTTKLAIIKAVATKETRMMVPREAGNLPRIT